MRDLLQDKGGEVWAVAEEGPLEGAGKGGELSSTS
jgi:hypothetical protein